MINRSNGGDLFPLRMAKHIVVVVLNIHDTPRRGHDWLFMEEFARPTHTPFR